MNVRLRLVKMSDIDFLVNVCSIFLAGFGVYSLFKLK